MSERERDLLSYADSVLTQVMSDIEDKRESPAQIWRTLMALRSEIRGGA